MGGDEFIILLPLTDYVIAEEIAGRIEKACSDCHIEEIQVNISLGISTKTKAGILSPYPAYT